MLTVEKTHRNMPRLKRSKLWKIPLKEFTDIVKNSESFCEILKKCGISPIGGNIHTLKRRLNEEKINYSHIPLGLNANKGRKFNVECLKYEDLFIKDCNHSRFALKKYIIKHNIIPYECSICGQKSMWNNKELVMVLDHINGIRNDNRLENLRFLCPNCNSQQETFAGKNNRKNKPNVCISCGKKISRKSIKCISCSNKDIKRKTSRRPSKDILLSDIKTLSNIKIGLKYGVSEAAIRKWRKYYNI